MYGHLQGFLGYLDMLAEGSRRHAELIGGRKFLLTGHQKSRLFGAAGASRVSTHHGRKAWGFPADGNRGERS